MNDSAVSIGSIDPLRSLPSVNEVLTSATGDEARRTVGHERTADLARLVIESLREELRSTAMEIPVGPMSRETVLQIAETRLAEMVRTFQSASLQEVINATGVIVHTNLGRAPLSASAKAAMLTAAGYANVEFDVETGTRGRRGGYAEDLLKHLTGAEDAVIVNNCAAAALLILTALAPQSEVIVSRGELVEIGGDFRVPDVLERSGCILHEVGTTNRTKIADYERVINERTAMILRVHPSNFKITGFTAAPSNSELAAIAAANNILFVEDAGSGALVDLSAFGITDERPMRRSVEDGADVVCFSGDKLLGGPQAGLIVGRTRYVEAMRKHPLFRALRPDKATYAALAATLAAYERSTHFAEIPVLNMIALDPSEIHERAHRLVERIDSVKQKGWVVALSEGHSVVGGGSAPDVTRPTTLISIRHDKITADEVSNALRRAQTPVIARILDGRVVLDLRTVTPEQEMDLVSTIEDLVAKT